MHIITKLKNCSRLQAVVYGEKAVTNISEIVQDRDTVTIVHWSASDRHVLCQRGSTGSSEVASWRPVRQPVIQHRWTTSLEHSTCFCLRHKLVLALQETAESISFCLTATAPVALNWHP